MKKLILISGALMILYVILTAAILPQTTEEPVSAVISSKAEADGYVIREMDDRLVVMRGGEVLLKTDTRVSSLPKRDRKRLSEGITVLSKKELKDLLEDFCS